MAARADEDDPEVASGAGPVRPLAARRGLGAILLILALGTLGIVVPTATEHRHGPGGADCGTLLSPSELSSYPERESGGCHDAIDDGARLVIAAIAVAVVLLVAGLSLLVAARLGGLFWMSVVLAAIWVALTTTDPGIGNAGTTLLLLGVVGALGAATVLAARGRRTT
jgi:hypothetical protein